MDVSTPYVTRHRLAEGQNILGITAVALTVADPIELSIVVFADHELPVHSVPFPLVSTSQHIDDEAHAMTES